MCKGLSCILLSIFNSVLIVVGLILAVVGGLLKWNKTFLESVVNGAMDKLAGKLTDNAEEMINSAMTVLQQFSGPLGLVIFIIGIILIVFACIGFIGVCCHVKCFLVIYAAVLSIIVLAHAILVIVYFANKNIILNPLRKLLKDAVDGYESVSSTQSVESMFLSIFMPTFQCCGYNNGSDFKKSPNFKTTDEVQGHTFNNLEYPIPCCLSLDNLDPAKPDACPMKFTKENSYIEQGCGAISEKDLVKLADKVALYSLIAMAFMVLVLIGTIILIVKGSD